MPESDSKQNATMVCWIQHKCFTHYVMPFPKFPFDQNSTCKEPENAYTDCICNQPLRSYLHDNALFILHRCFTNRFLSDSKNIHNILRVLNYQRMRTLSNRANNPYEGLKLSRWQIWIILLKEMRWIRKLLTSWSHIRFWSIVFSSESVHLMMA